MKRLEIIQWDSTLRLLTFRLEFPFVFVQDGKIVDQMMRGEINIKRAVKQPFMAKYAVEGNFRKDLRFIPMSWKVTMTSFFLTFSLSSDFCSSPWNNDKRCQRRQILIARAANVAGRWARTLGAGKTWITNGARYLVLLNLTLKQII